MGLRGLLVAACAAAAAAAALGASGWAVADHLEQDDDFCNACHVSADVPLHREIRRDYDTRPARSLAGAHAAARAERRTDGAFRCIDCHGGAGWLGRARVKALAAKDALAYALGRFEEPQSMRFPLRDEDCLRCHTRFEAAGEATSGAPRFHELALHNAALGVACVECHGAHATGGDPRASFLRASSVRAQCARCHSQFAEGA
jgi:nitrate/TMAO reductase-like tetraheme cytochrome c subunit